VQGISDLITIPGLINVDFADVRTIMSNMGMALMGTGCAAGQGRAVAAAKQAVESPLLEDVQIDGATGILINITGGPDMTLFEVNEASSLIHAAAHEDANIIFGSVIDESMGDLIKITVIATGFAHDSRRVERNEALRLTERRPAYELSSRTDPGPGHQQQHAAPAIPRYTPPPTRAAAPTPAPARVTPPPAPMKTPAERPVRHLSASEVAKMAGIDEDELDIPTFLRHTE
jgi:cell division protein FtsZ